MRMPDEPRTPATGKWEQLNRCPVCGAAMERAAQVGEQVGLITAAPNTAAFDTPDRKSVV